MIPTHGQLCRLPWWNFVACYPSWQRWSFLAEGWLLEAAQGGPQHKGRGVMLETIANTPSAPQDPAPGLAVTVELRSLHIRLARVRRLEMYRKLHGGNPQQQLEWAALERKIASETLSAE